MAQRIHELTRVEWPAASVPGAFRIATPADEELAAAWISAFHADVGEPMASADSIARARIAAGGLFFWDDAEPASMAGVVGRTPGGVRIALVYTPPPKRGRGYASACVAALSQRMLDAGNRFCCLYTDLANPTSNAIYRRLGYRPVCDSGMYVLEA
jgi:predicted GNAT family acetyltransferase